MFLIHGVIGDITGVGNIYQQKKKDFLFTLGGNFGEKLWMKKKLKMQPVFFYYYDRVWFVKYEQRMNTTVNIYLRELQEHLQNCHETLNSYS